MRARRNRPRKTARTDEGAGRAPGLDRATRAGGRTRGPSRARGPARVIGYLATRRPLDKPSTLIDRLPNRSERLEHVADLTTGNDKRLRRAAVVAEALLKLKPEKAPSTLGPALPRPERAVLDRVAHESDTRSPFAKARAASREAGYGSDIDVVIKLPAFMFDRLGDWWRRVRASRHRARENG